MEMWIRLLTMTMATRNKRRLGRALSSTEFGFRNQRDNRRLLLWGD